MAVLAALTKSPAFTTQAKLPGLADFSHQEAARPVRRANRTAPQQPDFLSFFNNLVLDHQDAVYNFAFYLLGDPDLAEDVTQKAFLNAYLSYDTFHGPSVRSWLLKIVKNAAYDELRRIQRHPALSIEDMESDETSGSEWDLLSSGGPTPEQEILDRERADMIQDALARLGEAFRMVIVLVDIQELDYQEAAQVLGVPVGTVKSRLARARQQFRVALESLNR